MMRPHHCSFIPSGLALSASVLAACTYGVGDTASQKPNPGAAAFSVGGTVAGLTGSGLVLQDNGGDNLSISANGAFTFPASLPQNSLYNVSVLTQPVGADGAAQTCTVAKGTGMISAAVTNVTVTCAAKPAATATTDSLGGSVAGLAGSGLVLENSDGQQVAVSGNGPFTLETKVAPGTAYAVTVLSQPTAPAQTCSVANGTGTTGSADVSSIVVTCESTSTASYAVGGTVTGLTGTGASIVLEDDGRDPLTVSADGPFAFGLLVPSGSAYSVSEESAGGTKSLACTLSNASGVVGSTSVTNITVSCQASTVTAYTIGGTVTGLTGTGASLALQDNGGDTLTLTSDGPFTFATPLSAGATYSVTQQLTSGAISISCTLANALGSVASTNVTNVTVTCQPNTYAIGVTVTGLTGSGGSLLLLDNGGDGQTVTADGSYTFATPVASGGAYNVTLQASGSVTCTPAANAAGTVGSTSINVAVTCQQVLLTPVVTVTGLRSSLPTEISAGGAAALVLQDNLGDQLTVSQDGTYQVSQTPLVEGAQYTLTVGSQPGATLPGRSPPLTDIACYVTGVTGVIEPSTTLTVQCVDRPLGFVYVTNGGDGTISSYIMASSGALVPLGATPAGTNPSSVAWLVYSPSETSYSNYVYVTNAGSNSLVAYTTDPSTGVLAQGGTLTGITDPTSVNGLSSDELGVTSGGAPGSISLVNISSPASPTLAGSPIAAGNGPVAIATAATASSCSSSAIYAYVANSQSSSLSAYTISTSSLTPGAQTYPTGAGPDAVISAEYQVAGTAFEVQSGSSLYTANAGDGTISQYGVNCDGSLSALGSPVSVGAGLSSIAVNFVNTLEGLGTTEYLYATSAAGVTGFSITPTSVVNGTVSVGGVLGPPVAAPTPVGTTPGPITSQAFPTVGTAATVAAGSATVTLSAGSLALDGAIFPGEPVLDSAGVFPQGTTVVSVSDDYLTVTLSSAATAAATDDMLSFDIGLLYVVDTSGDTVTALSVNPDGTLTVVGAPVPTGKAPTSIVAVDRYL